MGYGISPPPEQGPAEEICMKEYRRVIGAIVAVLLCVAVSQDAGAETVEETEEVTIEFRGLVEAGSVWATDAHGLSTGPRIGMARLAGRATYEDLGRFFVQVDGASGNVGLLDALAVLEIQNWLHLRAGYFKTPTSTDYNISASQKPFPARALVADLTPRRAPGVEVWAQAELGDAVAAIHVGEFLPGFPGEPATSGGLFAARAEVEWPVGLGLHVGYADHFDRLEWPDDEDVPFYVSQPRLVDLAATFSNDDWFGHAEVVMAPHRDPGYAPAGVYVAVGHRVGTIAEELTLEPIVGYDLVAVDTEFLFHRVRTGLNAYLLDYRVVPNVHYEMTIGPDSSVEHAVLGLLRIAM